MNNKETLKSLIEEAEKINSASYSRTDVVFKNWRAKVKRCISRIYGLDSLEYEQFKQIHYHTGFATGSYDHFNVEAFHSGIEESIKLLEDLVEELESSTNNSLIKSMNIDNNDIFVVHGGNQEVKNKISAFLLKQGINPIILNEQANKGKTIIEKIEDNSNVGCAICLFTADDIGGLSSDDINEKRSRQNVIFETGYFMGKLGREKVIIISDREIDFFSDINGCVYIDINNFEYDLLRELKNLGYSVDIV